ncbi:hypothetical protein FB451DRAFT_979320, partial [Mycena latifolia]
RIFGIRAKEVFNSLGIDLSKELIIYSDASNFGKVLCLKEQAKDLGLNGSFSFGIGTFLTDDSEKNEGLRVIKALNMVINLSSVDDRPCVKLA